MSHRMISREFGKGGQPLSRACPQWPAGKLSEKLLELEFLVGEELVRTYSWGVPGIVVPKVGGPVRVRMKNKSDLDARGYRFKFGSQEFKGSIPATEERTEVLQVPVAGGALDIRGQCVLFAPIDVEFFQGPERLEMKGGHEMLCENRPYPSVRLLNVSTEEVSFRAENEREVEHLDVIPPGECVELTKLSVRGQFSLDWVWSLLKQDVQERGVALCRVSFDCSALYQE